MSKPTRQETYRALKQARNKAIRERFDQLYNEERIRYDDCISHLAAQYFLTKRTIQEILRKA